MGRLRRSPVKKQTTNTMTSRPRRKYREPTVAIAKNAQKAFLQSYVHRGSVVGGVARFLLRMQPSTPEFAYSFRAYRIRCANLKFILQLSLQKPSTRCPSM